MTARVRFLTVCFTCCVSRPMGFTAVIGASPSRSSHTLSGEDRRPAVQRVAEVKERASDNRATSEVQVGGLP